MKTMTWLGAMVLLFCLAGISRADLWDRGGGLIYDDVQNITWLQNANLAAGRTFDVPGITAAGTMTPLTADLWIAAMNAESYLGYSDWRLPSTSNPSAYGDIPGEMQHLYKVDLGNVPGAGYGEQGSDPVNFSFTDGNNDSTAFENAATGKYWYDESYPPTPGSTNSFYFYYGHQYAYVDTASGYIWPVRDGDSVPIPTPGPVLLFTAGMGTVAMLRRRLQTPA